MRATRINRAQLRMEKQCITSYVIIGNQTDIKFLHKKLQELVLKKRTGLQYVAHTLCPHWINYSIAGHFYGLSLVNPRQITFSTLTDTEPEPKMWMEYCRRFQSTKCYFYAAQPLSNQYKTNDYSGKFFPGRYMVVTADGTSQSVISHNELFSTVATIVPVQDNYPSLETFGKAVSMYRNQFSIYDIIIVNERGKCLTPTKYMIGQYIN